MRGRPLKPRPTQLGQILTDLRLEKGLSTAAVSEASNVSATLISGYERGRVSPNIRTLEKLLNVFGYEMEIVKK